MAMLTIASMACGFAALGVALYAHGPSGAAAALFGSVGALAGGLCAALQRAFQGRPAPHGAALPAQALARLVRTTLASAASAASELQARPGNAADRRPALPAAAAGVASAPAPAAAPAPTRHPLPADARRFASSAFGA